jgi:FkbM family methyltransferase
VFIAREVCKTGVVYAFEPRRLLFQMLCANLALNGIANVWAFQKAIGTEAGALLEGGIPTEGPRNYGSFDLGSLPGADEAIEVVALDDMLGMLKPISLMKVDVEGAELAVLSGARKFIARDRPLIYVENDRPAKSRELIAFIAALDYQLWWHVAPLFRPNNFAETRQNIFGAVCSVNMICAPRERKLEINALRPVDDFDFHPARPTPAMPH